jgi:beta-N-acetylhexosaminidase
VFGAIVAALALAVAGPAPAPTDDQLAGARVVTGFSGHHPPKALRRMIREGEVSGVILFSGNAGSRRAVRRLTTALQSISRPAAVDQPLLVTVDQEGGLVRRLPGPPKLSAIAIGARGPAFSERAGRATGKSLRGMGVNVDLAPVLDIGRPGSFITDQERTFGGTAESVSARGVAFARGLAAGGVAATAKHFPGLGGARLDTDNAVQRVRLSADRLRGADESTFAAFSAAGGRLVMLSTGIYPALAHKPAAFSRAIATGELRDRLGFQGVSITDALGTVSARAIGGPARSARAAAAAGADLVLFTDLRSAARAQRALAAGLGDGSLDRAEFEQSVDRVLALRATASP